MKTHYTFTDWALNAGVIRFWVYRRPGLKYEEDNSEFIDDFCSYGIIKEIINPNSDNPVLGIETVEGDENEWVEDEKVSIITYYHFNEIRLALARG